jgi:hypothetical protein
MESSILDALQMQILGLRLSMHTYVFPLLSMHDMSELRDEGKATNTVAKGRGGEHLKEHR